MKGFIEWLEKMNKEDAKVRAVLRRSLSFDPGTFVPAYPYVEPFLRDQDESAWRRKMFYLVAGIWAAHWREDRKGPSLRIGQACAKPSKTQVPPPRIASSHFSMPTLISCPIVSGKWWHYLRTRTSIFRICWKDFFIGIPSRNSCRTDGPETSIVHLSKNHPKNIPLKRRSANENID